MMKKLLFAAIALLIAFAPKAWAYDFYEVASNGDTLYYNINGTSAILVGPGEYSMWDDNFTKPSGELVIPSSVTYNGDTYTVTEIGDYAFQSCNDLTSVTIPNTVTSIGEQAFCWCNNLSDINIPNSVTSIGNNAFNSCNFSNINLPNSLISIGNSAFSSCTKLTTVNIPNSVTSIGRYAFNYCPNLLPVNIPSTVTSIGENAFDMVRHIEYHGEATGAPWGAYVMNGVVEDGFVYLSEARDTLAFYIGNRESVTIASTVTAIGNEAFGANYFDNCKSLTSVYIPNSVETIGEYAFYDCGQLDTVSIGSGITSINTTAFSGDTIMYLYYNSPVVGSQYFGENVNKIVLGDAVTTIGAQAFQRCETLTSVTIGSGVSTIGNYAFYSCIGLDSIVIPDAVTSIGQNAFYGCALHTLIVGNGLTNIGSNAFSNFVTYLNYNCPADIVSAVRSSNLETVVIGDEIQAIPYYAFSGCSGLTSVTIGSGVTTIGNSAFSNCTSLSSITIGEAVATIDGYAFFNCTSLSSIIIGDAVTTIGGAAFENCTSLSETHYTGSVEQWLAIDIQNYTGNPINYSQNFYLGDSLVIRLQIPEGVTNINDNFKNDTALTYIYIPSTVTNISAWAFNGCAPSWFIFRPAVPPTLASPQAFLYTLNGNTYGSWMMVPWLSLDDYKTATNYTTFAANLIYPDSCQLTVNVNDPNLGTVTLDGSSTLTKVYQLLDIATVAIAPIEHYHQMVQIDGCTNISQEETEVTTYQLRFNKNVAYPTMQVNFVPDTLHVGVAVNNELFGTVSGEGYYAYGDMVTVEATPANGYYFVRWADGSTENPATFVCAGDTTVTAIFSNDVTPELCMVSVQNNRNVLLWNTEDLPITSYTIYREGNVSGEYEAIATIPYAEAGMFNDTASRPATRSYRYHLTATDTCGNESDHGETHKTMHLTISQGIGTTWNLVWTEYEGAEYTTYVIYRGTDASNIQQIDIMPSGGNTTYSDVNAPEGTVYYQVGVMMTTPCNTSRAATISRSNIATNGTIEPPSCELIGEETAIACGEYEWHDTTYTESGDYEVRVNLSNGCDSVITLHLTINQPQTELVEITACGSYEWNDSVYTESGEYTETYTAANGCDSIVTLRLTINNSVQYSFSESAESPYIWNDTEYTETGEYTQTFTAANGCDSVVTLHLDILTGISALELAEINLYPNPVNDILNIASSETISEIEIVNVMGQVVKRVEVNADNAACNVEDLVSGVYVIRIRTFAPSTSSGSETAVIQRKFVKE